MDMIANVIDTIVAFFVTGGAFMYPILIVFAFGLAIAIERYIKLVKESKINRRMWEKIHPVLTDGDFEQAREMVENDDESTISKLLSLGLERQGKVRRREDIEIAMEEGMMEIIPQLEKRTPYVALLANISTLLGLLGTIMGLIAAFTAVAKANPAEKADLLSASISVAMNTTAFGLMAGIPLLIVHAYLTSKTAEIVDSLEMASVKVLNIISLTTKRQNDAKVDIASTRSAKKTGKKPDNEENSEAQE
ncbi:MAG: MotA/TolQ/ExbB proton channel family protein [Gammaproteobacteria bacterium]|nr:MotA/TolQ/ExbB proton channel family protein [Gammaproteobacteria bacterium]